MLSYASRRTAVHRRPRFVIARVLAVVFGVAYPIAGLVMNQTPGEMTVMVDWQNGEPLSWVTMTPMAPAVVPLLPFLLFGWICMVWSAISPATAKRSVTAWAGLGTGVLMGLQFTLVVAIGQADGAVTGGAGMLGVQAIGFAGAAFLLWIALLASRHPLKDAPVWVFVLIGFVLFILVLAVTYKAGVGGLSIVLLPLLLAVLVAAPASIAAFLVAGYMLTRHDRRDELAPSRRIWFILSLIAAANLLAWIVVRLQAWSLYKQLPTTPPQYCFVATAASGSARSRRTNHRQLRTLQTFESLVAARHPSLHQRLRGPYNLAGPGVAEMTKRLKLEGVVHALLRPVETVAAMLIASACRVAR